MLLRQIIHAIENENIGSLLGKTIREIKVSKNNDKAIIKLPKNKIIGYILLDQQANKMD